MTKQQRTTENNLSNMTPAQRAIIAKAKQKDHIMSLQEFYDDSGVGEWGHGEYYDAEFDCELDDFRNNYHDFAEGIDDGCESCGTEPTPDSGRASPRKKQPLFNEGWIDSKIEELKSISLAAVGIASPADLYFFLLWCVGHCSGDDALMGAAIINGAVLVVLLAPLTYDTISEAKQRYKLLHRGYGQDIKKQLANIKNKIAQMCTRNNVKIK